MSAYSIPVLNLDTGELRDVDLEADCWETAQVSALSTAFSRWDWRRTTWLSQPAADTLRRYYVVPAAGAGQ
jgi:hypothetical protein